MKNILLLSICAVLLAACSTVPITGRKQLSLVSNQEVMSLSLQEYDKFMQSSTLSSDKANTALVVKVGQNIANAVGTYYKSMGMEDMLDGYTWEFHLVQAPDVNAFCMPGGKIVVYEGILPYTQNETGLAVVLGHEVAHAVAKHSNERMSQQLVSQYGAVALSALLSKSSATTQQLASTVYGLGAEYGVMLPFSRKQELEADHLGLIFMAIAGYDPNQAIPFWERMSAQGGKVPEFMSTHPSDQHRIEDIQKEIPDAIKIANSIKGKSGGTPTPQKNNSKTTTSDEWKF